jgi:hypothetical protein
MARLLAAESAAESKARDSSESEQDPDPCTTNDSDTATAPQNLDTDVVTSFRRRFVWSGFGLPPLNSSSSSTTRRDLGPRGSLQDVRKRYKRILDRSQFTKGRVIRRLREARRPGSALHHRCDAYHGEDIILGPDPNMSAVFTSINCVQCHERAEEMVSDRESEGEMSGNAVSSAMNHNTDLYVFPYFHHTFLFCPTSIPTSAFRVHAATTV